MNVRDSYMVSNAENLRYVQLMKNGPSAESYDQTGFGMTSEWVYESAWVGIQVNNIKCSFWNYHAHHLEYCFGCHGSGNLFGCTGIRNGEYYVFNKPYSKTEYETLVQKIKKHMDEMPYRDSQGREYRYGDFFPVELCPWKYNETTAMEYFPKTKEEAIADGFSWRDADPRDYLESTTEIPDHVKDVGDITNDILKCVVCGKNYRIIKMELDFYRSVNVPVPLRCPLCRERERLGLLNPMAIYNRQCAKCGKDIETSYAPDRPEIVYCESCYNSEVA